MLKVKNEIRGGPLQSVDHILLQQLHERNKLDEKKIMLDKRNEIFLVVAKNVLIKEPYLQHSPRVLTIYILAL